MSPNCPGRAPEHVARCRAGTGRSFRPYDLVVVEKSQLCRQEHFVISPAAVTCIAGGAHSDVTPLGEWDRERAAFNHLCHLGFYRHFITRRSFSWWRTVCIPLSWSSAEVTGCELHMSAGHCCPWSLVVKNQGSSNGRNPSKSSVSFSTPCFDMGYCGLGICAGRAEDAVPAAAEDGGGARLPCEARLPEGPAGGRGGRPEAPGLHISTHPIALEDSRKTHLRESVWGTDTDTSIGGTQAHIGFCRHDVRMLLGMQGVQLVALGSAGRTYELTSGLTCCGPWHELCMMLGMQGVQLVAMGGAGRTYEVDEWADLQLGAREQYAKPALDAILTGAQHVRRSLRRGFFASPAALQILADLMFFWYPGSASSYQSACMGWSGQGGLPPCRWWSARAGR